MAKPIRMEKPQMSEEATTTETEEVQTEVIDDPHGETGPDWKLEARKWEARAKADHEAANSWREFESGQKSEYEKMADELTKVKTEAQEANLKTLRYEVAQTKGIPSEAIDLLTGSTLEELESSADKLAALIAAPKNTAPRPDFNQGRVSGNTISTKDQFAAALQNLL
jgi:hypothetical protein